MGDKFRSDVIADTINTLYNELSIKGEGSINLDMPYQRDIVWTPEKKKLFIDSIIKHIIPQTIILNINSDKNQRECIDGKQRCISIKEFINNEWPIEINGINYFFGPDDRILKRIADDYNNYKVFLPSQRSDFKQTKIPVTTYHDLEYHDQLEIFGRIQNGSPLTDGEKMTSYFPNIISYNEITNFFEKYKNSDAIKNYTSFDRKKHHSFLMDIMFYINQGLKAKNTKNMDTFISSLAKNNKLLRICINDCKNVIMWLFTDDLLNHSSICKIKLKKYILCTIIYYLFKNFNNDLFKKKSKYIRLTITDTTNYLHKNKTKISNSESSVKEINDIFNKFYKKNMMDTIDKLKYSDDDMSDSDLSDD